MLLVFCFTPLSAQRKMEQKEKCHEANNLIATNFWTLIPTDNVTFYDIQYHRKITCSSSLGLELKLPTSSNILGYSVGVEYRHYFLSDALDGFYLAPGLAQVKLKDKNDKEQVEVYSFNIIGAYSIIFGKHFTLDLGLGLTYNTGPYLQNKELQAGYSSTLPNIRFSLAWAF